MRRMLLVEACPQQDLSKARSLRGQVRSFKRADLAAAG